MQLNKNYAFLVVYLVKIVSMQNAQQAIISRLAQINWFIVGIVVLLAMCGFAMMFSAGGGEFSPYASRQMLRFAIGFMVMFIAALLPMRFLIDFAYPVYFLGVAVLVVVEIMGHTGMGAQRWIRVAGFTLQPSEFMKLALILALARYFHNTHPEDIRRISFLIVPALLIAVPAALILKQPNLGTATITALTGGALCFLAGVRWRYFIGLFALLAASAPVLWNYYLHDYQKQRVLTFLDPQQDPLGSGYNILQSIIAIGSGGFIGKGYLQGTQNQLNFLPEKHTDFIFTMLAEEFGFAGSMSVLFLFGLLLLSGMVVALRSRSTFGAMIAAGVVTVLFLHILINCGMVMGMMPVVGLPLPLMSYGGSIMLSTMLGVGLILNAHINRDQMPVHLTPRL